MGGGQSVRRRLEVFPKWNSKRAKKRSRFRPGTGIPVRGFRAIPGPWPSWRLIATVANSKFSPSHSKDESSYFSNRNKTALSFRVGPPWRIALSVSARSAAAHALPEIQRNPACASLGSSFLIANFAIRTRHNSCKSNHIQISNSQLLVLFSYRFLDLSFGPCHATFSPAPGTSLREQFASKFAVRLGYPPWGRGTPRIPVSELLALILTINSVSSRGTSLGATPGENLIYGKQEK